MITIWKPFDSATPLPDFALSTTSIPIWQVALDQPAAVVARLHPLLNAEEQARAARFYFAADQRRYIVGRGVLRLLLSRYVACAPEALPLEYNAYGKPALGPITGEDAPLHFNLSHSGEVALYAMTAHCPVGIDIERMRPNVEWDDLAKQVFSPNERRVFGALPATERMTAFFRCWTRKEAFIKAHGKGLAMPLDQFDVTLAPDQSAQLLATHYAPTDRDNWSLCDVACPSGYAAALVLGAQPCALTYGLCDLSGVEE